MYIGPATKTEVEIVKSADIVLHCIVFIHFYGASLSVSHQEAPSTTVEIEIMGNDKMADG